MPKAFQFRLLSFTLLLSIAFADKPPVRDIVHDFQPNIKPSLFIPRLTAPIVVDGSLNDAGWQNAARAVNFAEFFPGDGTRPPIHMETLITYNDTHLYLAFLVEDNPDDIRASLRDRDEMWSDDYVGILLDTYGDANWAYFIFANPLGIQGDARFVAGLGEDDGVDLIFDSEGQITDKGYQVEMAIPFSSLRFPDTDIQNWKATFWITHPRGSRSQYTWAAIDRDNACWMCQWGTLAGIKGIKSGRNIEILPSIVGSQIGSLKDEDDPTIGFNAGKPGGDLGLGLKYMITPNVVADVALNPDFSQVEADAAQIDVNQTFALFYPERRPFFQEGGDLFRTNRQVVYTRSINNPSLAAKLTGRFGKLNVAYMSARDENSPIILPFEEQSITLATALKSVTNIVRAKQSFGEDAFIGAMVTDRRLEGGGSGSLVTTDGRFTFL
ncbi:MAG: carbohydrate binding family 9 domain-containing protein, partial [Fidelibacterota bacterium]